MAFLQRKSSLASSSVHRVPCGRRSPPSSPVSSSCSEEELLEDVEEAEYEQDRCELLSSPRDRIYVNRLKIEDLAMTLEDEDFEKAMSIK